MSDFLSLQTTSEMALYYDVFTFGPIEKKSAGSLSFHPLSLFL